VQPNPADRIVDDLIRRSRDKFDALGGEIVRDMREMIGVPVSGSGRNVVRSKPGEPPRKETGALQGSWRHHTVTEGDTVRTVAGTPSMIGVYLQKGTATIRPRPHASTLFRRVVGRASAFARTLLQTK
jgi:hypothetical protein